LTEHLNLKDRILFLRQKYFAEKQLFLRSDGRVRFLTIGSNTQVFIASTLACSLVWGAMTSYAYLTRDLVIEQKNQTISSMSAQYQSLSSDFSSLEEEVERRTGLLEGRQEFLEELLAGESEKPDTAETNKDAPQETEAAPAGPAPENISLLDHFFAPSPDVQMAVPNGDRRKNLLARLESANKRQQQLVTHLLANAEGELATIENALAPTKLNVETLLAHFDGDATAVGGPFIPDQSFEPVFESGDEANLDKLIATKLRLEMATKTLDSFPVGIPAAKYYVSSKFGRRRDPLKKTWANHPGLDLAGWPGTAIYATAPGKVVHAGWFGPYGRMVEIEHGNGFKTRYGHMRKLRVKKGDTVIVGTRVGDMGKTGRVTGTHLHYEIWFDGSVRDPAPFLKAADNVLKIQGNHEKTNS